MTGRINIWAILFVVIAEPLIALAAEPRAWSYSMQEMYERAQILRAAVEKKKSPTDVADLVETSMKAAEFKGYIAASLDRAQDKDVQECAKVLPVNDIAYRTAVLITSNPLDRSGLALASILASLKLVCDQEISKRTRK